MLGIVILGSLFGFISAGFVLAAGHTVAMALFAYCLGGAGSILITLLVIYSNTAFSKHSVKRQLAHSRLSKN